MEIRKMLMSKYLGIPAVAFLLLGGVASATVLGYFGQISSTVTVNQAVLLGGTGCLNNVCSYTPEAIEGGEAVTSEDYTLTSITSVDAPIEIVNSVSPDDDGITQTNVYLLSASGTDPRENRVHVSAANAGVTTLGTLNTITFEQYVESGYVGHVDVLIDTDGDGVKDDALVFEYAKVDPADCDNAPYPTGEMSTFGDKGTVRSDSYAWLSSGSPGPCGGETFYHYSLAEWISGQTENGKTINTNTVVMGFEFEVDSWVSDTKVDMWDITVNGSPVDVSVLQAEQTLTFNTVTEFGTEHEGTYIVSTNVIPVV